MATFKIELADLGGALKAEDRRTRRAINESLKPAAERGRAHLEAEVERMDLVDTGVYRDSFAVSSDGESARLGNTAPIAGMVELGARPHFVPDEEIENLRSWVARKLLETNVDNAALRRDINAITWSLVKKLKTRGQEPRFVLADALPMLRKLYIEEVEERLRGAR